jgi:hypothetical protein
MVLVSLPRATQASIGSDPEARADIDNRSPPEISALQTPDGVVTLGAGNPDGACMGLFSSRQCQGFFDHWRDLPRRPGMLVPHIDDFLDAAPAALMPSVFIQEVLDDGIVVRFMGTELVERWRHDLTGKVFAGNLDAATRARLLLVAATVCRHPCGLVQLGSFALTSGRPVTFEAVLLPLAVDSDRPPRMAVYSRILGMLERNEHGSHFAAAGTRAWLDIGAGLPPTPPPPQ